MIILNGRSSPMSVENVGCSPYTRGWEAGRFGWQSIPPKEGTLSAEDWLLGRRDGQEELVNVIHRETFCTVCGCVKTIEEQVTEDPCDECMGLPPAWPDPEF